MQANKYNTTLDSGFREPLAMGVSLKPFGQHLWIE
jgi:hypothetical protein